MLNLLKAYVLVHSIHGSVSQYQDYQGYYQNLMNPSFYQEQVDYSMVNYPQHKHQHHHAKLYGTSGGVPPNEDYDSPSEECRCSCNQCEDLKPCCRQVCTNCNQPNVLFIPYPYPLVVSGVKVTPTTTSMTTEMTTSTTSTTITTPSTTTSTTPASVIQSRKLNDIPIDFNDLLARVHSKNSDSKYMLTALRRTKSNWLPKYGIVPIPDQLAETLMSQMRSMKNIN